MSCVTPPVPTQRRGRGRDHGWGTLHVTRSTPALGTRVKIDFEDWRNVWQRGCEHYGEHQVLTLQTPAVFAVSPSSWRRFTPQLATLGRAAESHIAMSGHQTFVKPPPARAPIPAATVTHCEARLQHCSGDTTQSAAGGQIETLVTLRHREGIC